MIQLINFCKKTWRGRTKKNPTKQTKKPPKKPQPKILTWSEWNWPGKGVLMNNNLHWMRKLFCKLVLWLTMIWCWFKKRRRKYIISPEVMFVSKNNVTFFSGWYFRGCNCIFNYLLPSGCTWETLNQAGMDFPILLPHWWETLPM